MAIKELEHFGQASTLKARRASDALMARSRSTRKSLFAVIDQETNSKIVKDKFISIITEFFKGLSEEEKNIFEISEENLEAYIHNTFKRYHSLWFRFYLHFDPGSVLQRIKCPVLAINGDKDVQVTSKENLQAIKRALEAGENTNYTVKELPNLNHLLQTAETGNISEYAKIEETMSPTALQIISDWITKCALAGRTY
jgi:pimeloyl-ACP methyl ester carboxylesterase